MNNYAIKVSKDRKSAMSETPTGLIFNSDYKTFNVEKQGIYELKVLKNLEEEDILIEHNLGFSPAFLVFHEIYPDLSLYQVDRMVIPIPEPPNNTNPTIHVTSNENSLKIHVNHPFDFMDSVRAKTNKIYYMIFNIPLEGA